MKVFISWSGPQSRYIAHALRAWLPRVIQHLDPWMSESDIKAGQRWENALWKELQDSHFGVVCLTAENLQAPWLHFEAGALAKAVDQQVCPYLHGLKPIDVKGPLSHLHMKQANKKETKELLQSINKVSSTLHERVLPQDHLDEAFETWWPKLDADLNAVPPSTMGAPLRRDTADMLEELLGLARDIARQEAARQTMAAYNPPVMGPGSFIGQPGIIPVMGRVVVTEPIPTSSTPVPSPNEPEEGAPPPK